MGVLQVLLGVPHRLAGAGFARTGCDREKNGLNAHRRRHPRKPEKLFSENKKPPKRDMPRPARPPKTPLKMPKAFFRKQETPKKGHAHAVCAPFAPISQSWSQFFKMIFHFYETMYALVKMAQKKFRNLPSDARFCAKRFRHIDFWTFFLSIF